MNFFYLVVVLFNVIWIHDVFLYYIIVGAAFASNIVMQIFKFKKSKGILNEKRGLFNSGSDNFIGDITRGFRLFDWNQSEKK